MEESSLSAKLKNYKAEESGTNYARLFLKNSSDTFRELEAEPKEPGTLPTQHIGLVKHTGIV